MKIKHSFEHKPKNEVKSSEYEYIETENYIFLKLNNYPSYVLCNNTLSYEMDNILFNNVSENSIRIIYQISDLKIISGITFELKSINYSYDFNTQKFMMNQYKYLELPFIVRRK